METALLQSGTTVRLRAFGGKLLVRKVVGVKQDAVLVSTEGEIRKATEEGREPDAIGWAPEDVVEIVPDV